MGRLCRAVFVRVKELGSTQEGGLAEANCKKNIFRVRNCDGPIDFSGKVFLVMDSCSK